MILWAMLICLHLLGASIFFAWWSYVGFDECRNHADRAVILMTGLLFCLVWELVLLILWLSRARDGLAT